MIEFRKCYPDHLLSIDVIKWQTIERANVVMTGGAVANHGVAMSGWVRGRCLWAGGVIQKWPGVGFGWALFGRGSYDHIEFITECARGMIRDPSYKRVEITVEPDYKAGHRWARALGMTLEAERLRCYGPGGRDMALYSYIGSDT